MCVYIQIADEAPKKLFLGLPPASLYRTWNFVASFASSWTGRLFDESDVYFLLCGRPRTCPRSPPPPPSAILLLLGLYSPRIGQYSLCSDSSFSPHCPLRFWLHVGFAVGGGILYVAHRCLGVLYMWRQHLIPVVCK